MEYDPVKVSEQIRNLSKGHGNASKGNINVSSGAPTKRAKKIEKPKFQSTKLVESDYHKKLDKSFMKKNFMSNKKSGAGYSGTANYKI